MKASIVLALAALALCGWFLYEHYSPKSEVEPMSDWRRIQTTCIHCGKPSIGRVLFAQSY